MAILYLGRLSGSCQGHLEVVTALLAAGAPVEGTPAGEAGLTALIAAAMGKHAPVVRTLLEARADANRAVSFADFASAADEPPVSRSGATV